jgi:thiamine biosynthesis protein ThiS
MAAAETNSIEVVLNGEPRRVSPGLTLADLLRHLQIDPERVAVELDRRIVRRTEWASTAVMAGAQIEVVHFVGGGRS